MTRSAADDAHTDVELVDAAILRALVAVDANALSETCGALSVPVCGRVRNLEHAPWPPVGRADDAQENEPPAGAGNEHYDLVRELGLDVPSVERAEKRADTSARDAAVPNIHIHGNEYDALAQQYGVRNREMAQRAAQPHGRAAARVEAPRRGTRDAYAPVRVRGRGARREGQCPHCPEARWLRMKQSCYWYHLHYVHGVSAATGLFLPPPLEIRPRPAASSRAGHGCGWHGARCGSRSQSHGEGLCGTCGAWVPLATRRRATYELAWWRHAQRCVAESVRHGAAGMLPQR